MSSTGGFDSRIRKLEEQLTPPCPTCRGWVVRLTIENVRTGHFTQTFPARGCPTCGQPVDQLVQVIRDDDTPYSEERRDT